MASENVIKTATRTVKPMMASTYCIHSDNKHSVEILQYIHNQMKQHELTLDR